VAIARALATHEMGFALEVAHRVVMDEGVVLEDAAPVEFFTHPSHPRTRSFLAKILRACSTPSGPASRPRRPRV
jgi:ABC-type polar amino acid transport system ATPase subunit